MSKEKEKYQQALNHLVAGPDQVVGTRVTGIRAKNCTCHTCHKDFHHLGISRHRAMHRARKERCRISYSHGGICLYKYDE